MFVVGAVPAVLVLFIWRGVEESPAYLENSIKTKQHGLGEVLLQNSKLAVYAILLMACFNFFSHGSQDAYPNLFLKKEHHFDTKTLSNMTEIANVGAILGGLFFGWLSEKIGRRRAIMMAALLSLPVIPFWAFGSTPVILAAGAFFMQVCVQGAWGIIPVHLNELSPPEIRATFPGVVYQLGNLVASSNLTIQVTIAEAYGDNYGLAMALVVGTVGVLIALMVARSGAAWRWRTPIGSRTPRFDAAPVGQPRAVSLSRSATGAEPRTVSPAGRAPMRIPLRFRGRRTRVIVRFHRSLRQQSRGPRATVH
jgi:SHS family lactate transporter-like MFS transporter